MKKIFVLLLVVLLLMGNLAACSTGAPSKPTNDTNKLQQTQGTDPQDPTSKPTDPLTEDWGKVDTKSVVNAQGIMSVIFRWPAAKGKSEYTGNVASQDDGTLVLVDAYSAQISPEVESLDQVFPAYFEQTVKVFASFYGSSYSDGSLTIEDTEVVTVGEYEFYKHTGTHNYKYKGSDRSRQYVIYLTETKATGAYIYWLVSDTTADQSAGAKMEDNAYRIALSVRENF